MAVAEKMLHFMENASWIRKMFEEGTRLKQLYGVENVYDFSLGNPNVPPPEAVRNKLAEVVDRCRPGMHGYMPNAGLQEARCAVSEQLSREFCIPLCTDHIITTCGAAGGLNIIFKALLDPGDEVLVPAPYFVEYVFYADNHGGVLRTIPTLSDFTLDLARLDEGVGPRTKVVLINSPNNPTGQIYSEDSLKQLGRLLEDKSKKYGRTVYLVSDEPYRKIVYDNHKVPCPFDFYPHTLVASSYSKELSLPGERIGFVAVHPHIEDLSHLLGALTLANRILGFVNAPALIQHVVAELQGLTVDVQVYQRKRDRLVTGLKDAGYELTVPPGAFYLFPRSPLADDVQFVKLLQEENILTVPGSGFGGPGHFRIAYCVEDAIIEGAIPGFQRALERTRIAA